MRRGVRRGCIRLQGAVLGIDDEDDANFTITVDAKVFHLQAKDAEEREIWVSWTKPRSRKESICHSEKVLMLTNIVSFNNLLLIIVR